MRHLDPKDFVFEEFEDALLDEYTHDAFWEHINFEDPCEEAETEKFRMCGASCPSKVHDKVCDTLRHILRWKDIAPALAVLLYKWISKSAIE